MRLYRWLVSGVSDQLAGEAREPAVDVRSRSRGTATARTSPSSRAASLPGAGAAGACFRLPARRRHRPAATSPATARDAHAASSAPCCPTPSASPSSSIARWLTAKSASPVRAAVLRPQGRAVDAGADGQGAHLSQRHRQQDSGWPASGLHGPGRPGSGGGVALQRLHALQPVPAGDRCRAQRFEHGRQAACGCAPISILPEPPVSRPARRTGPPRAAKPAPPAVAPRSRRSRRERRVAPLPPRAPTRRRRSHDAGVGSAAVADRADRQRRRRLLDRPPTRPRRVAHRDRPRPWRP